MRRKYFRDRDWNDPKWQEKLEQFQQRRQRNRTFFGLGVAVVGVLWILKIVFHIPFDMEMQWPFLLIGIGILIGLKNKFRN